MEMAGDEALSAGIECGSPLVDTSSTGIQGAQSVYRRLIRRADGGRIHRYGSHFIRELPDTDCSGLKPIQQVSGPIGSTINRG